MSDASIEVAVAIAESGHPVAPEAFLRAVRELKAVREDRDKYKRALEWLAEESGGCVEVPDCPAVAERDEVSVRRACAKCCVEAALAAVRETIERSERRVD